MSDFLKTWCFAGSASWKINGSDTIQIVKQPSGTFSGQDGSAIYFTIDTKSHNKEYDFIDGHAYDTSAQISKNFCWDYSYTTYSKSDGFQEYKFKNCGAISFPVLKNTFVTNIPVFNKGDTTAINNYLKNGDDSGRVNPPIYPVKWDLYIDGTKNPLYKLTWDCADVKKSDYSKVKILYCGSDETIPNTYIVKYSQYYEYNDKSVKLNYHDIREAVWGDISVETPVTIIVQFEYFESTTVVPKGTSS